MRAILLSGGIDSAALACWQKPDLAININYGQKPATDLARDSCLFSFVTTGAVT